MTDESIGTARIDVTVNTQSMQAGIAAAQGKMSQFGTQAAAEYDRASASSKKYADSLLNQINNLGKSRAEQIAYNAQVKLGGDLGAQLAASALKQGAALQATATATGAASAAMGEFGLNSSRARIETARLFEDLARGNIGGAQRAILSLSNSAGLLAPIFTEAGVAVLGTVGVLGAFALAAFKGEAEANAYNKALIDTGNFAGITADRLSDMAKSMSEVSGTQHDAADALQNVVATGKFTADQIQLVARATEDAGDGANQMLQDFVKLADDPVKAITQLNDTQHFLTASTYDQIKALQDQGDEQAAATLAIQTYANATIQRTADVKQSLGVLETGWDDVKDAAKGAWDSMLDIGRPGWAEREFAPVNNYLTDLVSLFHQIQNPIAYGPLGGNAPAFNFNHDAEASAAAAAAKKGFEDQATGGYIGLTSQLDQYKTAEQQRTDAITKAHGEANAAIAQAIKAGDTALVAKIKASESQVVDAINAQYAERHHKADPGISALSTFQQYANGLNPSSLTVQGDTALTKYVQDMAALDSKFDEAIAKGADARKATALYWDAAAAELKKYKTAQDAATAADQAYADQLAGQLLNRQREIDLQVASIGMGQKEFQQMQELNQVYDDFNKQLAQLNREKDNGLSDTDYQNRLKELEANETATVQSLVNGFKAADAARQVWQNGLVTGIQDWIDEGQDVAGMTQHAFTDAFGSMNDALVNFVETGKLNFKDLANSIIGDLTRMALQIEESQILSSLLNAFATGPSGYNVGYFGHFNAGAATNTANNVIDSIMGKANGGVYGPNGEITAFASGGVVSRPTLFPFAKGIGLMGEAGDEAIMPLSRDASGKLGVKAQGGGGGNTTVIIENHGSDKPQVQQSKDANGNDLIKIIVGKAVNEVDSRIARGGSTYKALQHTFGLQRRGVPVSG